MTSESEIQVVDRPEAGRFEALLDGRLAGVAEYRLAPGVITFVRTEVGPAFEGRGVGGRLAAGALDEARARGLSVRPRCPFINGFIRRHPEYADLVDPADSGDA